MSGRRLATLVLLALVALVLALTFREEPSADTWFHLAAGRRILGTGHVPRTNEFLAFERDHPFVDHEWLFQVGTWLAYRAAGETGVGLAKTALVLAAFAFLFRALRGSGDGAALLALFPAILLAESRFLARPELASILGVAVVLWLLERDREERSRANPILAGVTQVLWVNSHGFALLGPVVTGTWMLAALVERDRPRARRLGSIALVQTLALFVNPSFHEGALYPLALLRRAASDWSTGGIQLRIIELQSPFTAALADVFEVRVLKLTCGIALVLALAGFHLRRTGDGVAPRRLDHLFAALVLAASAFVWLRNLPFAALGLAPVIADGIGDVGRALARWKPTVAPRARTFALGATAVVALVTARAALADELHANAQYDARAGLGFSDFLRYDEAVSFLDRSPPRGKLFNNFGAGHFLVFARDRKEPLPYVCGLTELYSTGFLVEYHKVIANELPFAPIFESRGITDALLDHRVEVSRDFLVALASDPGWRLVHVDSHCVIVRRTPTDAPAIDLDEVARAPEKFFDFSDERTDDRFFVTRALRAVKLLPARRPVPLARLHAASLLEALGRSDAALALARRANELRPGFPPTLFVLSSLERRVDPRAAEAHALELAAVIPSAPYPHVSAGLAALVAGEPRRAVTHFERALELDPTFELAQTNVLQAYLAQDPPDLVALKRALATFTLRPEFRALYEGHAAEAENDPARAEERFRAALAARPSLAPARFHLGNCLFRRRAFAEAAQAYEDFVKAQPRDGQGWLNLGMARVQLHDRDGAEGALLRAAFLRPRDATPLVELGRQALDRRDLESAARYAQEALKRDPRSMPARALDADVRRARS